MTTAAAVSALSRLPMTTSSRALTNRASEGPTSTLADLDLVWVAPGSAPGMVAAIKDCAVLAASNHRQVP